MGLSRYIKFIVESIGVVSDGDDVFTAMMWLKVTSVYCVLRLGWDVLFQDADLVWFRDPVPFFSSPTDPSALGSERDYDAYFQDDGARSQRYAPFSANTGFYFLRSNVRTVAFVHDLLNSYHYIAKWRSHQHVLDMLLVEHYTKSGLDVKILPQVDFAIGQLYHRRKDFMSELFRGNLRPYVSVVLGFNLCGFVHIDVARFLLSCSPRYVFHWSWTAGKHEKLKYSKETGMWYLASHCKEADIRRNIDNAGFLKGCCRRDGKTGSPGMLRPAQNRQETNLEHDFLLLPTTPPPWLTDKPGLTGPAF